MPQSARADPRASAVTFIAATNYLKAIDHPIESYSIALLAIMEASAILVGVVHEKMELKKTGEESGAALWMRLYSRRSV